MAAAVLMVGIPTNAFSQRTITVDFGKRAFATDTLPFGEPFVISGTISPKTDAVAVRYGERTHQAVMDAIIDTLGCQVWTRDPRAGLDDSTRALQTSFAVVLPRTLRPNRNYLFEIKLYDAKDNDRIRLPAFDPKQPRTECTALSEMRDSLRGIVLLTDSFTVRGQTPTDYKQRFDNDIGLVRSERFQYVGFVSNLHYYFVPINKNEDLADPNLSHSQQFLRRFSLMAGLSLARVSSNANVDNVFGIGTPMVGVGLRGPLYWPSVTPKSDQFRSFFQPMRLNAGIIWFKQKDANPLVAEMHTKRDFFVSVTADVGLKTVLGPFAGFFGSK
ncbi:MAG TPA: hypothetical protein VFJ82_21565 [Longimicrobium sp.]|nr:hypothetical protein [Longimicrobium sp.]